jgi:hypothetical protein
LFILDPDPDFLPILNPGVNKAPDPGPDPEHWGIHYNFKKIRIQKKAMTSAVSDYVISYLLAQPLKLSSADSL